MTARPHSKTAPRWFEASFLALSALCFCAYFLRPALWNEHWAQLREWRMELAHETPPVHPSPRELREMLLRPDPRPAAMLMTREAVSAWLLRDRFPAVLDRHLAPWLSKNPSATADGYRLIFEEWEAQWRRARLLAKIPPPVNAIMEPHRLRIEFAPGTRTADIGSHIAVDFTWEQNPPATASPPPILTATWTTSALPRPDSRRVRQLHFAVDHAQATAHLDLSGEPAWCLPNVYAHTLEIEWPADTPLVPRAVRRTEESAHGSVWLWGGP